MEIEPYSESQGWRAENLNRLIQRIHDTLMQEGVLFPDFPALFNISFEIQKNRSYSTMGALVVERDGVEGLQFLRQEFKEWVAKKYINPGKAWKEYSERWESFLNADGKVDYSYNERIQGCSQLENVIKTLAETPYTRQAYIEIYQAAIDSHRMMEDGRMVPCILGYHFTQIEHDLNMTVMARSIDANNCLMNDIWLADRLLNYVVEMINRRFEYSAAKKITEGSITFMISNLHSYPDIVQGGR